MKKILIISPYFPPVNAPDSHRVRHSINYYSKFGWLPEVVTINSNFIESYSHDRLLEKLIDSNIKIHALKIIDHEKTRFFGIGSIALRSFNSYRIYVDKLLETEKYDLIFFSTTIFSLMPLGVYWKMKYRIPFVLDIQDPWRNDYYFKSGNKTIKSFLSYFIDCLLERITVPRAKGVVSVSKDYLIDFNSRYRDFAKVNQIVIPFSGSKLDFSLIDHLNRDHLKLELSSDSINFMYVGRCGADMEFALTVLLRSMRKLFEYDVKYEKICKVHFIGTSYAGDGKGEQSVFHIALKEGVADNVIEITDRISLVETLYLLKSADFLIIPGSIDKAYTASKLYPYLLANKPLVAVFHENSSVVSILKDIGVKEVVQFNDASNIDLLCELCLGYLLAIINNESSVNYVDELKLDCYLEENRTKEQCDFFNLCADS